MRRCSVGVQVHVSKLLLVFSEVSSDILRRSCSATFQKCVTALNTAHESLLMTRPDEILLEEVHVLSLRFGKSSKTCQDSY